MIQLSDEEVLALIRNALDEIGANCSGQIGKLTLDSDVQDLRLDSITVVELIGFIEDRLALTFRHSDVARVRKLQDIAAIIRSSARAAAGAD